MSWYLQMATSVSLADSAVGVQFPAAEGHIKTHLWDLSTNLSKLNIFLKLTNIVLYES